MARKQGVLRPDGRPLYAQTVDALMDLLADGTYPPGHFLPPEHALARRLGVSRSTIREAVSHLEKDGLITRRHGIGTLVNERSQEQISGGLERLQSFRTLARLAGEVAEVIERQVSTRGADVAIASLLHVSEGEELVQLRSIEALAGRRMAALDSLIPARVVSPTEIEGGVGSLLDYLVENTDIEFGVTRSTVRAIDAGSELADRLEIAAGKSVLYLEELLYTADGVPMALLNNYFLTEHFNFTIYRRVVRSRIALSHHAEPS